MGRTGIFEVLHLTDSMRPLAIARVTANEIKQKAIDEGMRTLRNDGWIKTIEGRTTIEEVLRVTEEDES